MYIDGGPHIAIIATLPAALPGAAQAMLTNLNEVVGGSDRTLCHCNFACLIAVSAGTRQEPADVSMGSLD